MFPSLCESGLRVVGRWCYLKCSDLCIEGYRGTTRIPAVLICSILSSIDPDMGISIILRVLAGLRGPHRWHARQRGRYTRLKAQPPGFDRTDFFAIKPGSFQNRSQTIDYLCAFLCASYQICSTAVAIMLQSSAQLREPSNRLGSQRNRGDGNQRYLQSGHHGTDTRGF